jgi:hypothetical protein
MDWIIFGVIVALAVLAWYWWPKSDLNNDGKVDAKDAAVKVNDQITDAVTQATSQITDAVTQVTNKAEETVSKVAKKVADKADKNVTKRKAKSAGKTKKT